MGRRSTACKIPPGFFVGPDETQSVYTGKHQREGVATMPFLVAGLWQPFDGRPACRGSPLVAPTHPTDSAQVNVATVGVNSGAYIASGLNNSAGADADSSPARVEQEPVPRYDYDWAAYHTVRGDIPIDEAVTVMFAEFAVLHAELAGSVRSTAPLTMTLDVGRRMADRAERFIIKYVTPILGEQHSIKVQKLLCHLMDAVRMHGNTVNGNAAENESLHKDDKASHARTSRDLDDFTAQLVFQAQESRAMLQRTAEADKDEAGVADTGGTSGVGKGAAVVDAAGGNGDEEEGPGLGSDGDDGGGGGASAGSIAGPAQSPPRGTAYHLPLVQLSPLGLLPGLAGVETALGMDGDDRVRLASRVPIEARFDDGTTAPQLLYASHSFRGSPWYNAVLYAPTDDATQVSLGEVRAIVRRPQGDVAVLADMEVANGIPRCPLVALGCTHLAWYVPEGQADVFIRAVPVTSIRRALHVVPDFQDLVSRRGLGAEPAGMSAPAEERPAMRYFLNDFCVWG